MNMNQPRWANEKFNFGLADPNKVICKDCLFRREDSEFPSGAVIPGCVYGVCDMYATKPHAILFKGSDCQYYRNEYNPFARDEEDEDEDE